MKDNKYEKNLYKHNKQFVKYFEENDIRQKKKKLKYFLAKLK